MSTGIMKAQERYERWWLGKYVRMPHKPQAGYNKVVRIELEGPPSFVYGTVWLHFEDDSVEWVRCDDKYRPRKKDVEVMEAK